MSDSRFREAVARVVRGKFDIGLADVMNGLFNAGYRGLGGAEVAQRLLSLGYRRDGWRDHGGDRTPRFVRGPA